MRTVAFNLGVHRFIDYYSRQPGSSIQEIVNLGIRYPVENVPTIPSINNDACFTQYCQLLGNKSLP